MGLLFLLLLIALAWWLGALQLWLRKRWVGEALLWIGGALAVGAATRIAWGFAGVFRSGDWDSLSTDQAAHRLFGPGSAWFQRSGWPPLDGAANVVLALDLFWTLLALSGAVLHGYVFWAGVAGRRCATRARPR
ncbi:hypothetical protein E5843_00665 [Luteimonas yindakuii]|uniref:hypothetical protein n=1 Tax=Luteimonas yindakuii TaxID=2565782 RepID=UPI0011079C53|nr:hypothetical protein [Luteimonas yindakuii]QCO66674.2 hypothetical protein E5843_00665 [Luteimonas yindakuii]